MSSVPVCTFCAKSNNNLNKFTDATLQKCLNILKVYKDNNLSLKDVTLPSEVNDQKYHSKCYRRFTAVPRNYRSALSTSTK